MIMTLWKPDKQTRSSICTGDRKVRMGFLKSVGRLQDSICSNCGREIYLLDNLKKRTKGGSDHKCVKRI